jgi:hypothetical protein
MLVAMNFGDKNLENDRSKFQVQQLEYQSFKKLINCFESSKNQSRTCATPSALIILKIRVKTIKYLKATQKRKPKTLVE